MNYSNKVKNVRNIGIIAHIDAGKTTVTERILYYTGKNYKIGEVHEGETITDYMVQERERGITITSASVSCKWFYQEDVHSNPFNINIIDTPGHVDFIIEVERSLRVLDGAVVVFDGVAGVESQSETVWHQADRYAIPKICFINKLDRTGADFFYCVNSIKKKFSTKTLILSLPLSLGASFNGFIDIINMKKIVWPFEKKHNDFATKYVIDSIDQSIIADAEKYRNILIDQVIDFSDSFAEIYLENKSYSNDDVKRAIRSATLQNISTPICCGSAFKNKGVEFLLDNIIDFLPSPLDASKIKGTDYSNNTVYRHFKHNEKFSALVFKIITDKYGQLSFIRIYSGNLLKGDSLLNTRTRKKIKIRKIVRMFADKREDINDAFMGDIVAIISNDVKTGDTLSDINNPIILESLVIPPCVVKLAIEAESKNDQDRLNESLEKIAIEDPSFIRSVNLETNQTTISGMGELHLDIIIDRIQREYNVNVKVGKPEVAYKETILKEVTTEGKYIKQTGGRGQYGHVWLKLIPNSDNAKNDFSSKIVGGCIPKEFIPAIKKGAEEALLSGIRAGYPVINISVVLFDGSYHDVDSSEIAFKIASSIAIKKGALRAQPSLLEPLMKVEIFSPKEYLGTIINNINSRRGKISNIDNNVSSQKVLCFVPLSNMFGFSNDLRSKTQGRSSYIMEFNCYQIVPKSIEDSIISKNKIEVPNK
jgi:elongation factor G